MNCLFRTESFTRQDAKYVVQVEMKFWIFGNHLAKIGVYLSHLSEGVPEIRHAELLEDRRLYPC